MHFRYARDPLFLLASLLYLLNRTLLKPHLQIPFLHNYLNDLLLIPCALPLVLLLQRKLQLRKVDAPPRFSEIFFHLIIWSILFEGLAPHLIHTTSDPYDLLAYGTGGIISWLIWKR
jgi:hypothetical protein